MPIACFLNFRQNAALFPHTTVLRKIIIEKSSLFGIQILQAW